MFDYIPFPSFTNATGMTHFLDSNIKTSRLIRFGEIITVYSENHTLHENTLCGKNAEIFNIKECRIYSNLGVYKSLVTKFWTIAPNICGYSVWNMLHVTLLSPRILDDCKFLKHFRAPFATTLLSRANKYKRTPYLWVIRSKTYRGYVKSRIIPNAIYNMT